MRHRITSQVKASRFMTYHKVLVTQDDYIQALKSARNVAESLQETSGMDVYAYCLTYAYFEQYLYIVSVAIENTGYAAGW